MSATKPLIQSYLDAADLSLRLLADPAVAAQWDRPSALVGFTVCGLAGHLASHVFSVELTLTAPVRNEPVADLLTHYSQVAWIGADPEDEISIGIRSGGDAWAAEGHDALLGHVRSSLGVIRRELPARALDGLVQPPWLAWSMSLRNFLTTRLLELTVHSDDLAVSVGVDTPTFPPDVIDPVFAILTALAARRHGQPAVLRALSRAERAPAAINAM
jgi:hypothetical protein